MRLLTSALLGLAALLVGSCSVFVAWPLDVFSDAWTTIALLTLPDGRSFRVVQYWNHVDFYTTELQHQHPNGGVDKYVLDGDDRKRWSARIVVDAPRRAVRVEGYPRVEAFF